MILKFIKKHLLLIINLIIIVFLFWLPYFLFHGKYYISGDDTRLFYIFPYEYFKEFTFSSWHHFSSVGSYSSTQFMAPFLLLWSLLDLITKSKLVLDYLGFSLPLVLGFAFFQLFINEILIEKKNGISAFLGSLFFVCSPILAINQLFIFLSTIWLIPLIPLISFFLIRFIRKGEYKYIAFAIISCICLSLALFSIPWYLGFALPLFAGILIILLTTKFKNKIIYLKRSLIFFVSTIFSQIFWLLPFYITYFGKSDINFGSKILSKGVADTFSPTVLATSNGNIFYPLLNLFHRRLVFDFGWNLRFNFLDFYDKIFILNLIFPIILFLGIFLSKRYLNTVQKKVYFIFLVAFVISLYFFTVNIGPFKDLFLLFGKIPGFVMFRNFFDKFALAYIMFYAILLSYSFEIIIKHSIKLFKVLATIFVAIVLLNFSQVGSIVNAPLWQTTEIGRNIAIPKEYLNFMSKVSKTISSTNNIFTMPFGTALYSVIKDVNSDSVYTGTSPVKLFSGINDISGFLSFYFSDAKGIIEYLIINKDYKELNKILIAYNINYIFLNQNIPQKVLDSWVFDKRMNKSQDNTFLVNLADKNPIVVSENGNYKLYKTNNATTLLSTNNLSFKKINETKFKLYIKNLKMPQVMYFHDSFQTGWQLYPDSTVSDKWCEWPQIIKEVRECKEGFKYFEGDEFSYLFKDKYFSKYHNVYSKFFINSWTIDPNYIKDNIDKKYYKVNKDGSIDIEMTLYFQPQSYLYLGTIISAAVLLICIIYLISKLYKNYENKKKK